MLGWGIATVLAVALTTPWDWLPGATMPAPVADAGLDQAALSRIRDYREEAVPVGLATVALSLLVSVLLGFTALGARLTRVLPGRRHRWLHRCVTIAAVLGIGTLVTLPLRATAEYLSRQAGLSTRTWPSWAGDVLTSYLVSCVTVAAVLLVLAGLAARVRSWDIVASLAAGGFVLGASLAYPLVIEPLYASFTPMQGGPLRTSLLELAAEDGIEVNEVLVADASRRTTAVNAYVSGFGPTRRIVVYDTLLQGSPQEVRLIVAHELGHAAEDDVLRGTVISAAGAVAGVTALTMFAGSSLLRRRSGLGQDSAAGLRETPTLRGDGPVRDVRGDAARHTVTAVAGVPMVLATYAVASFAVLPLVNVVSRAVEARADVHALALTDDPGGFIQMQRRLATTNLNDPSPPAWRQLWFGTHPSAAQRVALAEGWRSR